MYTYFIDNLLSIIFKSLYVLRTNSRKVYKNKISSERTLMELMEFLEQHNFPNECFDLYCPVSKYFSIYSEGMSPDLTIIDPYTMQALAFFRVYDSEHDFQNDNLYDDAYHLNRHSNILLFKPYYVVIKNKNTLQFFNLCSILTCASGKNLEPSIAISEPIKYDILKANCYHRIAHNKVINKNKLLGFGKIVFSIVFPIISVVLLVLDALNIYELNTFRLIMYGIMIISSLIPYLAQITIKDFSVTLMDKNSQKDD